SPNTVNVGEDVSISTTEATGGKGEKTYKFEAIDSSSNSEVIKNFSSSKTATWTPRKAGTYTIKATYKDEAGTTKEKTQKVVVNEINELIINNFEASKDSPLTLGSSVKLFGDAEGEGTVKYEFTATSGGYEETIQSLNTNSTVTWTPKKAGTYTLTLRVTDSTGAEKTKTIRNYVVKERDITELVINSYSVSKSSPVNVGTTVTLNADAEGEGTVQYRFVAYSGSYQEVIKDFSTSSSVTWTPKKAGTYNIYFVAKDSTGKTVKKVINSYVVKATQEPLNMISYSASKSSPVNVGTAVTLNADAEGEGTVQYRFVAYSGSYQDVIKDFSTNSSVTWTPKKAGTYNIYFVAKDSTGKTVQKVIKSYVVKTTQEPLNMTSYSASKSSPVNVGTAVTLNAAATGEGTVRYRFVAYSGTYSEVIKDFSTSSSVTWTPKKAGTYNIYFVAKDSTGKTVQKVIKSYVVKSIEPVTINSITTSPAAPQEIGAKINIIANAKSLNGYALTYKFNVYEGLSGWKSLGSFTSANSVSWTPSTSGLCTIMVEVKDGYGNRAIETMIYEVKDKVTRVEENNSKINYIGDWKSYSSTKYSSNNKVMHSRAAGAKVTFSFTGTGIKIIGSKGTNKGYINVSIDGGAPVEVDLYSKEELNVESLFEKTGLTKGTHKVTIEVTGFQNLLASDCKVVIDAFDIINGSI
ncbi:MAG: hypothetical protein GX275_02760, partial [Clostridiales bacterium]|nr:hypothetical protein [Clostridiales bacterium]